VSSEQCEVDYELRMSTGRGIRELTTTETQKSSRSVTTKCDVGSRALRLGIPFRMPLEAYAIQLLK